MAAVQWVSANSGSLGVDPSRLAVAGDSAGGNFAAVVTQLARSAGGPAIAFQLLIYPALGGTPDRYPSITECAEGYGLSTRDRQCARPTWEHATCKRRSVMLLQRANMKCIVRLLIKFVRHSDGRACILE